MKKDCQVRFDDKKRQLTVNFVVNNVRQKMTLSYSDVRAGKVPRLANTRAYKLSYDEFKILAKELAIRFKMDPKVSLSWSDQFLLVFGHAAGVMHSKGLAVSLTADELKALKLDARMLGRELCLKAGVDPKGFGEALTAGYCSGVDTLFCTDDFIAIRKGNTIISRINLAGNDYNELKQFIRNAWDRIVSSENIEALKEGLRQLKLDGAYELACRKPDKKSKKMGIGLRED